VVLNLGDADAVARGWDRLHRDVGAYAPGLALDGVLVEAMGKRGTELIIGARNDPDWGPVILAGFGGVHAELLKDVRLIAHDLSADAVIAELRQLKSAALFDGFRGSPPLDIEAVAALVCKLGAVLAGTPEIREIDLNPVVVYPRGEGVIALDALILTS
jgi:acyl-CoA synthetase (NDP forming)